MVFVLELLLFHIIRLWLLKHFVSFICLLCEFHPVDFPHETQTACNKHRRYCLFVWIIRVTACATQHAQEIEPDSWWPPPMANPPPLAAGFITASLLPLKRLILPITSKLGPSPRPLPPPRVTSTDRCKRVSRWGRGDHPALSFFGKHPRGFGLQDMKRCLLVEGELTWDNGYRWKRKYDNGSNKNN